MQSLIYAIRFIGACFSMALKSAQLRKTWLYLWVGGIALLVFWLIPFGLVAVLLGFRPLGMILIGLFTILFLYSLMAWGEIIALEVCRIFDALIWDEKQLPGASQQKHDFARWQEAFLWSLMLPGLKSIYIFDLLFRPAHAPSTEWVAATYLMLPVIALDDFNLSEGVERIKQLVRDRLLRFHPDLVGVRPLVGFIQWVIILAGILLGFWVAWRVADPVTAGLFNRLLTVVIGVMLVGGITLLGTDIGSFYRACYYTTLYQWVLNVESARMTGDTSQGVPPAILIRVMRKKNPHDKEN